MRPRPVSHRVARQRLVWASAWAFAACIYPEPVQQDPAPTNSDSAPAIQGVFPVGDLTSVPFDQQCALSGLQLQSVLSPRAQPLTARLYLNYQPGHAAPISTGSSGATDFALEQVQPAENPSLYGYDFDKIILDRYSTQLLPTSPNLLTVFISDGFADATTPLASVGSYATSYTWGLDLTQCDPLSF